MIDYEGMILARQEAIEIWEDDPDSEYLTDDDIAEIEAQFYEREVKS